MKHIFFVLIVAVISACDTEKLRPTPDSDFLGKWKLTNRGILDNIEIEIKNDENGDLYGVINKLNEDKYVNLFMEKGDKFIMGIKRNSNFEFSITEKKIAAPLFSIYGNSTTMNYRVIFNGENEILLSEKDGRGKFERIIE